MAFSIIMLHIMLYVQQGDCLTPITPFQLYTWDYYSHADADDSLKKTSWFRAGFNVASLQISQTEYMTWFTRCPYVKKYQFAAFGVNWHTGVMQQHATKLRLLLLTAGDVEQNPGPTSCNLVSQTKRVGVKRTQDETTVGTDTMGMFPCSHCKKGFKRRYTMERHISRCHTIRRTCDCGQKFISDRVYNKHLAQCANNVVVPVKRLKRIPPPVRTDTYTVRLHSRGFQNVIKVYRFYPTGFISDMLTFLSLILEHLQYLVNNAIFDWKAVKIQLRATIAFQRETDPEEKIPQKHFSTTQYTVTQSTQYQEILREAQTSLEKKVQRFTHDGSGLSVKEVFQVDLYISKYQPFAGSTYIPLDHFLRKKHAIINIRNCDNKCFIWSVLAGMFPQPRNPQRVSLYEKYLKSIKMACLDFPVQLEQIPMFEEMNQGTGVNVFGYEEKTVFPLYLSRFPDRQMINLLLIRDGNKSHYCLIKNFDGLLYQQTKHKEKKHFCLWCLCCFRDSTKLKQHQMFCRRDCQRIEMATEPTLRFRNLRFQVEHPYIIYSDFECFVQDIHEQAGSKTVRVQKHVPNSFALQGVRRCCSKQKKRIDTLFTYRGDDVVETFLSEVLERGDQQQRYMDQKKALVVTDRIKQTFNHAKICHICEKDLGNDKVKDHCHVCGCYRGAAHSACNTQYTTSHDVVIAFHNLRKYDGHLIMQHIGGAARSRGLDLTCIPKGVEDYLAFALRVPYIDSSGRKYTYNIRFLDTLQFMNTSLEALVDDLRQDGASRFSLLKEAFGSKNIELLLRKQPYPYKSVKSTACFAKQGVPKMSGFDNDLTQTKCTVEEHCHAKNVYRTFKCANFGEFHDIYLNSDTLLIGDVFENFRDEVLEHYGLDPVHYVTLPSLAWDALLKMTNVSLELLQDPDKYAFFEGGIRGGISTINHRFSAANNPYLSDFNSDKPTSYLLYLDANNLYGWAMYQYLPIGGFEWVPTGLFDINSLAGVADDSAVGFVLEVDICYPTSLHDVHNDFPMAPDRIVPKPSPYCEKLVEELKLEPGCHEKLAPNFMPKEHYIVHYRNLKMYMRHGLKVTKVHRVMKFKQDAWMRKYIDFNTQRRKLAKSSFAKNLFKYMNNAVFGKSMENVRKYKDIRLVTDESKLLKLFASPLYKGSDYFTDDLVAVSMGKKLVKLQKPIFTGFAVLDISKLLMYGFLYDHVKPKYGELAKVCFSDTDSFLLEIKTEDVYQDMQMDSTLFDLSEYPSDHFLFDPVNKKVMGKFKDELPSQVIREFVGLRAKMYSILAEDPENADAHVNKKRAKGVAHVVVKNKLKHADYKDCLFKGLLYRNTMRSFRSDAHEIYTVDTRKISLCSYDDKRYVLPDRISTLAHGHHQIQA